MKKRYKIAIGLGALLLAGSGFGYWYVSTIASREPSVVAWNEHCASCHGSGLEGTPSGPALMDAQLRDGDETAPLIAAITSHEQRSSAQTWGDELSAAQIKGLALFISERRQRFPSITESYTKTPTEDRLVRSKHYDFRLERVTTLASRPYSLAPLPDGDVLVSEKLNGLSIVDRSGKQTLPLKGTPKIRDLALGSSTWLTLGSLLDVELHPDYIQNGWIYLSHADRCDWWCGWIVPGTMVRVVRGRIKDGKWVDQEVIWSVHTDHYTPVPDAVAAGRLAFDQQGFLYVTVAGKSTYDKLHDLNTPFGKVHRVRDDGSIPSDNPFWVDRSKRPENSTIHTVWSYGHRTGQGLASHPATGEIWNSEMGPRGGDEINRIFKGQNYGWPLYTNGLDYNGEEVAIGKDLGLTFPIEDTVLPVVDFSPAPAVSNFVFHDGSRFPEWKHDLLLGTLKESALYRLRIEDGKLVEKEKLLTDFGRIRDVAMGFDGLVYLVLEHGDNGSLWRLVPTGSSSRKPRKARYRNK